MAFKVKKGGAYVDPLGIFTKKAGVYSPGSSLSVKVAGVYARADTTLGQQVAAIFTSGAKGVWSERSSAETLYRASAGTTTVSAGGQAVGLALSKDEALGLGSQLVTNGDFSAGTTGWTGDAAAGLSAVAGRLRITLSSGANPRAGQQITGLVPGKVYEIRHTVYKGTVPGTLLIRLATTLTGAGVVTDLFTTVDLVGGRFLFTAAATSYWLVYIATTSVAGQYIEVAESSVQNLAGNHQVQATASAQPMYQVGPKRLVFDGTDDVLNTTFPAALGSVCTIGRAIPGTGALITTGQTIGTSFADNVTAAALVIVDRGLTVPETAALAAYLNQQAAL